MEKVFNKPGLKKSFTHSSNIHEALYQTLGFMHFFGKKRFFLGKKHLFVRESLLFLKIVPKRILELIKPEND